MQVQLTPQEFITGMQTENKSHFLLFFPLCEPFKSMNMNLNNIFWAKILIVKFLGTGLAIFSCMPTTLSSGVALTQVSLVHFTIVLSAKIMLYAFGG